MLAVLLRLWCIFILTSIFQNLNPQYVWGGDAIDLTGDNDGVWVDHCKASFQDTSLSAGERPLTTPSSSLAWAARCLFLSKYHDCCSLGKPLVQGAFF